MTEDHETSMTMRGESGLYNEREHGKAVDSSEMEDALEEGVQTMGTGSG